MAINPIPEKIDRTSYVKETAGRRYAGLNKTDTGGVRISRQDTVSISSNSRELQLVRQAAGADPYAEPGQVAERAQKVEALKQAYQSGQYTVDTKSVAEKLVGAHISALA